MSYQGISHNMGSASRRKELKLQNEQREHINISNQANNKAETAKHSFSPKKIQIDDNEQKV